MHFCALMKEPQRPKLCLHVMAPEHMAHGHFSQSRLVVTKPAVLCPRRPV